MYAIFLGILAVVTWTISLLVLRATVSVWSFTEAGAYSRVFTVVLLLLWIGCRGTGLRRLRPGGTGGWLVLMGLLAILINSLWFAGMQLTSVTNAALLFRLDLLFVVLIAMVLGLERIGAVGWLVMPVMAVGLSLVLEVQEMTWQANLLGDVMIVGAAFCLAVNAFVIRHILTRMDAEAVALYNHVISGIGFTVLMLVTPRGQGASATAPSWGAWGWIVGFGILAAVSLPIYYAALRAMQVWKLRVLMLMSPLLAAVADWLLWHQRLTVMQGLGAALLLAGLLVLILAEAHRKRFASAGRARTELNADGESVTTIGAAPQRS